MNIAKNMSLKTNARRGAIIPLIAFLLPVVILFMGFAVDVAHMQNVRLEMRAATDAAARAAANTLARTDKTRKARNKAKKIAKKNAVAGKSLGITGADIVFGRSEADKLGKYIFQAGATPANAAQVTGTRDECRYRWWSTSLLWATLRHVNF